MKLTQTQSLMVMMATIQLRAFKDRMRSGNKTAALEALRTAHNEIGRLLGTLAPEKPANDNGKPTPPISGPMA